MWTFFLKFSGQNCKTMQNHQTLPKSAKICFIIWIQFHLISFWGRSYVFLCIFVCMCVKCIFASLGIFVETFVTVWLSQAFLAFWSCPQYHVVFYAFVLMYDIGIKFDIIYRINMKLSNLLFLFSWVNFASVRPIHRSCFLTFPSPYSKLKQ